MTRTGSLRNAFRAARAGAAATFILSAAALAQTAPAPKAQLPADQRAYNAARNTPDPAQRIAAYQAFLKDYPDSKRKAAAQGAIFETLLKYLPDRTDQIAKLAKEQVSHSGKGINKLASESNVSEELAEAGPNGIDLQQADKWANDGLKKFNEADFDKQMDKQQAAYEKQTHAKPPTPKEKADSLAQQHRSFLQQKAGFETSVAAVDLKEGKLPEAKTMLDDAYAIQPLDEDTNSLRGQLALANHDDAAAIDAFERAELCEDSSEEGLAQKWRDKLDQLYAAQHSGSDAGLTAALDTKYAQLFPAPFTPHQETPPSGGHTALLELFTGSACPPCVGGDLAVEGLLNAYPRTTLVALAFDQHIPAPDPLANADTQARADLYSSRSTPNYVLDGQKLDIYGQSRDGAQDLYAKLQKLVAKEAAEPTDVHLVLTASRTPDGDVSAKADVTTGPAAALAKQIVMPAPPPPPATAAAADNKDKKPGSAKPAPTANPAGSAKPAPANPAAPAKPAIPATPAAASTPDLVLNFALVEDDVRYSGQNGIRFHHYVVRSLAKPADSGFPVAPGATATLTASFDPKAISAKLSTYLAAYAKNNDRFGPITFLSTDTTMQPDHLYIAAWVQDAKTHRILDTAIAPVSGEPPLTQTAAAR